MSQAKCRLIDWRIDDPAEVLVAVEKNLDELEVIISNAGERKCNVLVFPEDTPGLLNWYGMNQPMAKQVLPQAVWLGRLKRLSASRLARNQKRLDSLNWFGDQFS